MYIVYLGDVDNCKYWHIRIFVHIQLRNYFNTLTLRRRVDAFNVTSTFTSKYINNNIVHSIHFDPNFFRE